MVRAGVERSVALVSLGCARNDVDSEELAGRLTVAGWRLVDDAASADVALVNTCGFIEQAKKDSIDTLLQAADLAADSRTRTKAVVAVGCLAERYGRELAESLPEADAVLGFDAYPDLARHLEAVLAGEWPPAHVPRDRRTLLPISPADRPSPAPATIERRRLDERPWAALKLAGGCDRRCTFCAIPTFRGAFVSRHPGEVLAEAAWLAGSGVREVFCVSENTTSYGKDLGDLRSLESLLPRIAAVDGIDRVRLSYLQPAEMRPGLVDVLAGTPGVAPYFDLSFQHSSPSVLRRMRRFGSSEDFLALIERVRAAAPGAGIRSNVIVGFPGEREEDLAELQAFLTSARLDVVGVFGYSPEEGTEAAAFEDALDPDDVTDRVRRMSELVEELTAQRAQDRVGEAAEVLVEGLDDDGVPQGRAAHQGPEVDGLTRLVGTGSGALRPGDLVAARVVDSDGVDLVARLEPR